MPAKPDPELERGVREVLAELGVADALARGLSDEFHVFHDVRLATRPTGSHTGEPLTLQVGDLGGRKTLISALLFRTLWTSITIPSSP